MNKTAKILLSIFLVPLAFILLQPYTNNAYASCQGGISNCYARESYSSTTNSGNKLNTDVTTLTLTNYCTKLSDIAEWETFSNGDFLENGFGVGILAGNCRTADFAYQVTQLGSNYNEYYLGNVATGSNQYFEISDTNKDKYWDLYWGASNTGHVLMVSAAATNVRTGEESNEDNPTNLTIPKTHVFNIARFVGAGIWQSWDSGTIQINGAGYYLTNCTPSYAHIHVETGVSPDCSGSH